MPEVFKTERRVEFRDTDMAGIAHFSNFFAYMEQAEHALLRSLGLGVICEIDGREISFPRVNAQCDYLNAIRFEEMIEIHVSVQKIGTKSITYGFEFFHEGTPVAKGSITVVCCLLKHGQRPESVPTPEKFTDAIKPYLVDG
jgi:4-hydroxybenzoyl-CoA thioesterase/acyl-CoA thioester hydrolase